MGHIFTSFVFTSIKNEAQPSKNILENLLKTHIQRVIWPQEKTDQN